MFAPTDSKTSGALLKRGLSGTYVSVEPFHLFRYLDEQMFRYNHRGNREQKITDADRFNMMLSQIAGKRLTYKEVTGKVGETTFLILCAGSAGRSRNAGSTPRSLLLFLRL